MEGDTCPRCGATLVGAGGCGICNWPDEPFATDDLVRRQDVKNAFRESTRFSNEECGNVIDSVPAARVKVNLDLNFDGIVSQVDELMVDRMKRAIDALSWDIPWIPGMHYATQTDGRINNALAILKGEKTPECIVNVEEGDDDYTPHQCPRIGEWAVTMGEQEASMCTSHAERAQRHFGAKIKGHL